MAVVKCYGFRRHSVFSMEGSFGHEYCWSPPPNFGVSFQRDSIGRRAEQAKANLDLTSGPMSGPKSGPTSVPTRAPTRAPTTAHTTVDFPCFQPIQELPTKETSREGVHGRAHESVHSSGWGSLVLFSLVLWPCSVFTCPVCRPLIPGGFGAILN